MIPLFLLETWSFVGFIRSAKPLSLFYLRNSVPAIHTFLRSYLSFLPLIRFKHIRSKETGRVEIGNVR